MNHLIYPIILLILTSCDKEKSDDYFINLNKYELQIAGTCIEMEIQISSNCQWTVSDIPKWCIVNITNGSLDAKLQIKIESNNSNITREASIRISNNEIIKYLHIRQDKSSIINDIKWFTFPINTFSNVDYTYDNNEREIIYTFKGSKIFINPSIKSKIFPGNLVNKLLDNISTIDDYLDYSYNPITIGCFADGKAYTKTINKPSLNELNLFADNIIKKQENQILSFNYENTPIKFSSYKQLYLLGQGNLGVDLVKLLGYSYTENKMKKCTGLIYSYCNTLFNITMDIPTKLVNEDITDSNMVYINNLNYGRTGYLIVESNHNYNSLTSIIKKAMKREKINDDEMNIIKQSSIVLLSFNRNGEIIKKEGNAELINEFIDSINKNSIIPLSFNANNYYDHHVESLEYKIILP